MTPRTFEEWLDSHFKFIGQPKNRQDFLDCWNAALASFGEPVAWCHDDFGTLELSRIRRVGWHPLYRKPKEGGK